MRIAFTLIVSSFFAFCSKDIESGNIEYKIIDEKIYIHRGDLEFKINVELTNSTSTNFILYGFRRTIYPLLNDSSLCSERPGAGNGIFITDYEGNRMPDEFTLDISGEYHYQLFNEDSLNNVFGKIRLQYTDGKETLDSGEARNLVLKVNLKDNEPIQQLK